MLVFRGAPTAPQFQLAPIPRIPVPMLDSDPSHTPHGPVLTLDKAAAARLTGLSDKTLGRLAARGEPVGRIKVGRRVLFHLPTLTEWLAARAGNPDRGGDAQ